MRRFTKELKEDLITEFEKELNGCWGMYGDRTSRYYNLDRAFHEGYGIMLGFEIAVDCFREHRLWTKNDDEYLDTIHGIWYDYRKKYFSAKGMRDPLDKYNEERERHKI